MLLKKLVVWVVGLVGGWAMLLALLVVLAVLTLHGLAMGMGNPERIPNFTGTPEDEGKQVIARRYMDAYQSAAAKTVDPWYEARIITRTEQGGRVSRSVRQERREVNGLRDYAVSWGLLAAIDKLTTNHEPTRATATAETLKPRVNLRDSTTVTETMVSTTCTDAKGGVTSQTTTETVTEEVRLLDRLSAWDGDYEFAYRRESTTQSDTRHSGQCTVTQTQTVTRDVPDGTWVKVIDTNVKRDWLDAAWRASAGRDDMVPTDLDVQLLLSLARAYEGDWDQNLLDTPMDDPSVIRRVVISANVKAGRPSALGWVWPVPSALPPDSITSVFGVRRDPTRGFLKLHTGVDIGASAGTPIVAARAGSVAQVKNSGNAGYGLHVILDHGDGTKTLYAHMSALGSNITEGAAIRQGDPVGLVGSTGNSTGPHLHFETRVNGRAVDPLAYYGN